MREGVSTENLSESDGPVATLPTQEQIESMRSGDSYELQLSIWDAVLFLGVRGLHRHEQFLLGVGYVINSILQSAFCLIVLHLGSDTKVLDDTAITRLEVWLDGAEPEGVEGVCGTSPDHALSTSYLQMLLMDEARDYFQGQEAIFRFFRVPLLTVMVILMSSGTVLSHARGLFDLTVALWGLTEMQRLMASTIFKFDLKKVEIITISPPQFLWMTFAVVFQATVIVNLLVFGCMWMVRSTSVVEVLLNAVSLTFITDTVEMVFSTIVPTLVKNLVKKMEPMLQPLRFHLSAPRCLCPRLCPLSLSSWSTVF